MASLLALSLAVGRFVAGWLSRRVSWVVIIIGCSLCAIILLLAILPRLNASGSIAQQLSSFADVPMLGFMLPLIGLFIAPIYPLLNSTVLSHLPKNLHAPMSGLIIISSALGGTLGSRIVGSLFKAIGGISAFYFLIVPISLLIFPYCLFRV